jgi:hypothetical protein
MQDFVFVKKIGAQNLIAQLSTRISVLAIAQAATVQV